MEGQIALAMGAVKIVHKTNKCLEMESVQRPLRIQPHGMNGS